MRYAVYITRAPHWSFEARERRPISEAEWRAYAGNDTELRPLLSRSCFDFHTGTEVALIPIERTWEWVAHARGTHPARPQTFEFDRGGVIVRAPGPELLCKAVAVARALAAKVIDDDGRVIGGSAAR